MRNAGSLYLILLGIILCAIGGVFSWLMWRSFNRAVDQRDWQERPCRILESRVMERKIGDNVETEFGLRILFGYEFAEQSRTSELRSLRGVSWSRERSRIEARAERYPVGQAGVCHVDPDNPDHAVLELDSKAPGYSLWFPLLIVAGGLGIITGALRTMRRTD